MSKWKRLMGAAAANALVACLAFAPDLALGQGKFSGVMFGDYYGVTNHHDSAVDGLHGLWMRRVYLTYDHNLPEAFAVRVRLEAANAGDFSTKSKMTPFIKDAYIKYGGSEFSVCVGLSPTPTWGNIEKFLGYRPVEKTPLDVFKMGSSRDTGVSINGKFGKGSKTGYRYMVGNDSGTSSEIDAGKAYYLSLDHQITPELYIEGYGDYHDKPGPDDWTTLQGFLGYKNGDVTSGILYAHQRREISGGSDIELTLISFYIGVRTSENTMPFFRVDRVSDPVPGADGISYFKMATTAAPTLYIAGVDFKLSENVHLVPNVELVTYRDPVVGPTPSNDVFIRLTFFAFWK